MVSAMRLWGNMLFWVQVYMKENLTGDGVMERVPSRSISSLQLLDGIGGIKAGGRTTDRTASDLTWQKMDKFTRLSKESTGCVCL